MNIFVVGGGRVGFHLAGLLSAENHDVTVIDAHSEQLEQIDYALDVSTVLGNAVSVTFLHELKVGDADLLVTATGSDEINLLAATIAKGLGARQVVARVHDTLYIQPNLLYENALNIDHVLSAEVLTAIEIADYIENPGIVAAEEFGRGLVQMRQVRVQKNGKAAGKQIKDICPPGCGVLLGVVSRNTETFIPHGDTVVEPGDLVTLLGHKNSISSIEQLLKGVEPKPRNVVIMGGGSIGLRLARILENRHRSVKLFDRNPSRCREIAAQLNKCKVVCRDVTSRTALDQENVEAADVFVATTRDDERNIVASVLAKEMGAYQSIAVVHQPDFAPLVRKLGIDHAVTPRASLANRILKVVHQAKVSSLAVLEEGRIEVLELAADGSTPIVGKALKDIRQKVFNRALVATIQRGDEVIVPSGEDAIQAGDSVVVIARAEDVENLQKMFGR